MPSPFNLALSLIGESYHLLIDKLEFFYSSLPPALRTHLTSSLDLIQRNLPHQIQPNPSAILLQKVAHLYDTTAAADLYLFVLLPLLTLLLTARMSGWWPSSGRYSPFTSFYNRNAPPQVTEDDYSYLPADSSHMPRHDSYGFPSQPSNNTTSHHQYEPHHTRHGSAGSPRMDTPANLQPDVLILKHKGTSYPLHFSAYSISDGLVKVRDVRSRAAKELGVDDPRRVKLLYKGKQMRDDKMSCKSENLKQNSEVMCVVSSEASRDAAGSSDSEGSDSVADNAGRIDPSMGEESKKKRKGHRGGKKKRGDRESLAPPHPDSGASTSRTASPAPPPPVKKPSTPTEMLDSISDNFETTLYPLARKFMANPPPRDSKERDQEYKKLSETILAQVILKLDGVETMGDEALRGRRKDMVKRVQGVLNELDAVGKR